MRAAHSLTGSCANLGLRQLAGALARLEHDAKTRELGNVPALSQQLPELHAAAMVALRHELDGVPHPSEPAHV
jgi:HPt (histidine-containing phosphotransfer) domain-containing protein